MLTHVIADWNYKESESVYFKDLVLDEHATYRAFALSERRHYLIQIHC